jgi:hypothetical protein
MGFKIKLIISLFLFSAMPHPTMINIEYLPMVQAVFQSPSFLYTQIFWIAFVVYMLAIFIVLSIVTKFNNGL